MKNNSHRRGAEIEMREPHGPCSLAGTSPVRAYESIHRRERQDPVRNSVTVHGCLRLPLPFTRRTFTGSLLVIRYLGPQSSGRSPRIARIHTNGFRPPRLRRGCRACVRRGWHASAPTAARTPAALLIAGRTESARSALVSARACPAISRAPLGLKRASQACLRKNASGPAADPTKSGRACAYSCRFVGFVGTLWRITDDITG